jgi:type II secretory pathway pseudopilin PulG
MSRNRGSGEKGFAFVELLFVISLLGIAGVAAVVAGHATVRRSRQAGLSGRSASVAVQLIDRIRTGLVTEDSGAIFLTSNGETFEATFWRRDDLLPGAIAIRVASVSGGRSLDLDVPVLVP